MTNQIGYTLIEINSRAISHPGNACWTRRKPPQRSQSNADPNLGTSVDEIISSLRTQSVAEQPVPASRFRKFAPTQS
jgi:hypothetical protein